MANLCALFLNLIVLGDVSRPTWWWKLWKYDPGVRTGLAIKSLTFNPGTPTSHSTGLSFRTVGGWNIAPSDHDNNGKWQTEGQTDEQTDGQTEGAAASEDFSSSVWQNTKRRNSNLIYAHYLRTVTSFLERIRPSLTLDIMIGQGIVSSRLDYCNALP